MTNKDYNELLKENQRLKLELEAAYTKLNYIQEELDNLSTAIHKAYSTTNDLNLLNKTIKKEIKEFSENIDLELDSKLNRHK